MTPPAPVKYEAHVATMEEVQKLLETAGAYAILIREVVVCLGALCGLRRGEMCALEWKDVDMDEGSLTVRHTMARRYNKDIANGHYYKVFKGSKKTSLVIDEAKTEASAGKIYIPSLAVDALRRMYLWQQRNRMLLGMCYTDNGLVLCHEDGHPCAPNWIYQEFEALLKETGLPHLRVHDLRHTAATLLLEQGVQTAWPAPPPMPWMPSSKKRKRPNKKIPYPATQNTGFFHLVENLVEDRPFQTLW